MMARKLLPETGEQSSQQEPWKMVSDYLNRAMEQPTRLDMKYVLNQLKAELGKFASPQAKDAADFVEETISGLPPDFARAKSYLAPRINEANRRANAPAVPAKDEFMVVTEENLYSQKQAIIEEFKRFVVFPSLDSPTQIISFGNSLRSKLDKFAEDLGNKYTEEAAKNEQYASLKDLLNSALMEYSKTSPAEEENARQFYGFIFGEVFIEGKSGALSINSNQLKINCDKLVEAISTLHEFDSKFKTDFLNQSISGDAIRQKFNTSSYPSKFATPEMDIILGMTYGFGGEGLAGAGLAALTSENIGKQYFDLMIALANSGKRESFLQGYSVLSARYSKAMGMVASDVTHLPSQLLPTEISRPSIDLLGTIKLVDLLAASVQFQEKSSDQDVALLAASEQFREMSSDQAVSFVTLLESMQPKTQCIPLSNPTVLNSIVQASKTPSPDFNFVFRELKKAFDYQNNIFLTQNIGSAASKAANLYSSFNTYLGSLDSQLLDFIQDKFVPILSEESIRISGLVPNPFQQVGIYGANLFFEDASLRTHPMYKFGIVPGLDLPISSGLETPNIRENLHRNQEETTRFRNTRSQQPLQYPYVSKPAINFVASRQTVDEALQSAYNSIMWNEGSKAVKAGSINAVYTGDTRHIFNPDGFGLGGDATLQQQKGLFYGGARHEESRYGDTETKAIEELSTARNFAVPFLNSYLDMYASHNFDQTANIAGKDVLSKDYFDRMDINATNRWKDANLRVVGYATNTMQDAGAKLTFSRDDFVTRVSLSLGTLSQEELDDLASRMGFTNKGTATKTQAELVSILREMKTPDGNVRRFGDDVISNFISGLKTDTHTTVKTSSSGDLLSDFEIYGKSEKLGTWVRANLTKEQKEEILRQMGLQSSEQKFADSMTHQYYVMHTNFANSGHTVNVAGETYKQDLSLSAKQTGSESRKDERVAFAFGYQVPTSWIEAAIVGAETLDKSSLAAGALRIANNMYLGGAWFKVNPEDMFSYSTGRRQTGRFGLGDQDFAGENNKFKGGAIDFLIKEKLNVSVFYSEADRQLTSEGTKNPQFFGGTASVRDFGFPNGVQFGFARRTDTGEGVLNALVTADLSENYNVSARGSGTRSPGGSSEGGVTVGLMNKEKGWAIVGSGAYANYLEQPYLETRTLSGIRKNVNSLSLADLSSRENIGNALGRIYSGFGAFQDWTLADDVTRNAYGSFGLQLWKWPARELSATFISSRLRADPKTDVFYAGILNFTDQFALAGGVLAKNDEAKRTDETITKLARTSFSSPDFAVKVQAVELQNKQVLGEANLSTRLGSTDLGLRGLVGPFTHRFDLYLGTEEFHGVLDLSRLDQTRSYGAEVGFPLWDSVDMAIQGIILNQTLDNGEIAKSYRIGVQGGIKNIAGSNTYLGLEMALEKFHVAGTTGSNPFFKLNFRWAP